MKKNKKFFFRDSEITNYIATLDGKKDHCEITYLSGTHEFPWDMTRALEIALMRTFCSKSISSLLNKTGEFRKYGQKRYDDTALLVAEFVEHGYDSPRGKAAIKHMNWIHSHYNIPNEDFLFVLSTFVLDPIDWIGKYGWRDNMPNEKEATFQFFKEVGVRMGLDNLPNTLAEMRAFSEDYIQHNCVYSESNEKLAKSVLKIVENWLPRPFRFIVSPAVRALMDDNLLRAFGFKKPPKWWCLTVQYSLIFRAKILRWIDIYRKPYLTTKAKNRTYPKGYTLKDLGPDKLKRKKL